MSLVTQPWLRTITFTRPSNTTQYTAGDAVSDDATTPTAATFALATDLSVVGSAGGKIRAVTLHKSDQDLTAASFRILFFDTQPAAAGWEDNAAIAITDAEFKRCIGFVDLTTGTDGVSVVTGDLFCKSNLDLSYRYVTGTSPIYVVIVATDTYTPASAEVFTLTVHGEQY